jgi:hypothetical protein
MKRGGSAPVLHQNIARAIARPPARRERPPALALDAESLLIAASGGASAGSGQPLK